LINKVLLNENISIDFRQYIKMISKLSYWKAKIKFILLKGRFHLTKILQGIK